MCALTKWLSRALTPAVINMHQMTGVIPKEFQINMMLWYPHFVVNEHCYTHNAKRLLTSTMQSDWLGFTMRYADHLFAFCNALTDSKSWIPVLQHSAH